MLSSLSSILGLKGLKRESHCAVEILDRMKRSFLNKSVTKDKSDFRENRLIDGEKNTPTVNYGPSISAYSFPSIY